MRDLRLAFDADTGPAVLRMRLRPALSDATHDLNPRPEVRTRVIDILGGAILALDRFGAGGLAGYLAGIYDGPDGDAVERSARWLVEQILTGAGLLSPKR